VRHQVLGGDIYTGVQSRNVFEERIRSSASMRRKEVWWRYSGLHCNNWEDEGSSGQHVTTFVFRFPISGMASWPILPGLECGHLCCSAKTSNEL
jgi:hypothetical protein